MSAPAGGGRAYTLTPGRSGVLLTEYSGAGDDAGAVLIINTSLSDRAWLAADSNVGPSSGVPLDPGTAIPWTNPGQVWAAADPAAAAAITLVATTAIGDWNPSPAAIAAEVAAQLLATGIPSVLVETPIVQLDAIGAGQSHTYQVGSFASIGMLASAIPGNVLDMSLFWRTAVAAGNHLIDWEYLYSSPALNSEIYARLAVESSQLQIANNSGAGNITVTLTGSNRPALQRVDIRTRSTKGCHWAFSGALVAGTDQPLTPNVVIPHLSGPAMATFKITGTGTGRFDLVIDELGNTITLCDSKEMITNAGGNLYLCRPIVLPQSGAAWQFHVQTAQPSGVVSVDLVV